MTKRMYCDNCNKEYVSVVSHYRQDGSAYYSACPRPECVAKRKQAKHRQSVKHHNIKAARAMLGGKQKEIHVIDYAGAWEFKNSVFLSWNFTESLGNWPDGMVVQAEEQLFKIQGCKWQQKMVEHVV